MGRVLLVAICTLALTPRPGVQLPVAADTGALAFRVSTAAGQPLAGTLVGIPALGLFAHTAASGIARLCGLQAGTQEVAVRAIGYAPWSGPYHVEAGLAVPAHIALEPLVERVPPRLESVLALPTPLVGDTAVGCH